MILRRKLLAVLLSVAFGSAPILHAQTPAPASHPTSTPYAGDLSIFETPGRDKRLQIDRVMDLLNLKPGSVVADIGAGGGDVSVALAEIVGLDGRVYAVDSDPRARDEVASQAAAFSQVIAITQAGEDLLLPEAVDLAFCRFLLMHVIDPSRVLQRMRGAVRPDGWVVAQEPVTSAGRVGGRPLSMPDARHPDVGASLPALVRAAGLEIIDAWAEAPAGVGPGPVSTYLASLTDVDPGDEPVVLPPLVTVVGRVPSS
jgi:SAM-dependent methyltransferase